MADKSDGTLRFDKDASAQLRASFATQLAPSLVMIYGPALGKRHVLDGACIIGRDAGATITIDSPHVSRHHAAIRQTRERTWTVADLGSTNGTLVNDKPIDGEVVLQGGELIKVGLAVFKFISGENVESDFYGEIYQLTVMDGLTRIHNRRSLDEFVDREMARSKRHANPLCVALVDIDHFKKINDEHGHVVGDDVLRELAARIAPQIRQEHLFARYGGEEFALVMPELVAGKAWIFCERLRRSISEEPFAIRGQRIPVTASFGISEFDASLDRSAFFARADEALYEAKMAGRDRVVAREAATGT
jgi:two-component system, cell cycle response regulator